VPPSLRKTVATDLVAGAACVMAAIAAFTTPFTLGADALTSVALGLVIAIQVVVQVSRSRNARSARSSRSGGRGSAHSLAPRLGVGRFVPWIVVCTAVVGFELFNYFEAPRQAHPTLSSLADEITRLPAGRSIFFLLWVGLGWLIVRRPMGARRRVGA